MHENLAVRLAVQTDASAGVSELIYEVFVLYGQRSGLACVLVEDDDAFGIDREGELVL